ncbi:hypothetical protein JKP88DRAFT_303632 [Tribonema minus]|uniref:RanBD1 domain-containing protein n=1 Tax=Tribonema minus TaxID=303371 RepID=A0A836CJC8_9STRA|nr:hypothetical protein JKP88DRAFT_303632 [Tribonema minus]
MVKRGNENSQLRKEDYEEAESRSVDAGTWTPTAKADLAGRKIVTGKRPGQAGRGGDQRAPGGAAPPAAEGAAKPSPFANFTFGLPAPAAPAAAPGQSKPGLPSSSFTFNLSSNKPSAPAPPAASGAFSFSQPASTPAPPKSGAAAAPPFSFGQPVAPPAPASASQAPVHPAVPPSFSFPASSPATTPAPPKPVSFSFGAPAAKAPTPTPPTAVAALKSAPPPMFGFGGKSAAPAPPTPAAAPLSSASRGQPPAEGGGGASASTANGGALVPAPLPQQQERVSSLKEDMVRLNAKYARWVDAQLSENPALPWNDGATDYLDFSAELAKKYPKEAAALLSGGATKLQLNGDAQAGGMKRPATWEAPSPKPAKKPAAAGSGGGGGGSGLFGSAASGVGQAQSSPAAAPAPPLFSFGKPAGGGGAADTAAAAAPAAVASGGFTGFNLSAPAMPSPQAPAVSTPFSFGASTGQAAAAAAPGGFSFGAGMAGAGGGFGGFGGAAAAGGGQAAAGGDEGEEMEKLKPAELGRNEDEEAQEETLHEVRAKLFKLDTKDGEKANVDLGVGVLRLTKHRATDLRRMVMRNDIGKVMLNAQVYAGMKFKGDARSSAVKFTAPQESSGELAVYTLRVKKGGLTELMDKLQSMVPSA